ncbi:hypothetical protein [Candidatus Harpocratesius sp.]
MILTKIREDLESHRYVELKAWISNIFTKINTESLLQIKDFLKAIKKGDINQTYEEIKKLYYTNLENSDYAIILKIIEKERNNIARQWVLEEKLSISKEYVNILLDRDIIAFQKRDNFEDDREIDKQKEKKLETKEQKIDLWEKLETIQKNPELLLHNGVIYQSIALSSVDNISGVLKESQIQEQMDKFQKYEKIARFIENLEYPLQSLFSFHQIGVIIYDKRIYLIKWVQFIDRNQILGGSKKKKETKVQILEDLGVKIGVELKENLELGDIVIFKNSEEEKPKKDTLEPLLSLETSLFNISKQPRTLKKLDFSRQEDCQIFVNQVLGRIESGILLLNQKTRQNLKNSRDIDIFIKISLEKLVSIKSINQRINILRDLASINKNPDNTPIITLELEKNYLAFIKELFVANTKFNLPHVLKEIRRLGLFDNNIDLFINTMVYLFDLYSAPSQTILTTVEYLLQNWKLSENHLKLLEKPQIIAITNIVADYLKNDKFSEILTYLSTYLETHPQFRSQNLIFLLLQILQDLFNPRHVSEIQTVSNILYLKFFENVIHVLNDYLQQTKNPNQETIKLVKSNIINLSNNLDFISFINEKISQFLQLIKLLNKKYISYLNIYQILQQLCQNIPLICFHKKKAALATNFFKYLTDFNKDTGLVLDFLTSYIKFLIQSTSKLNDDEIFSKEAINLLLQIKTWEKFDSIHPISIKPLQKNISILFNEWYQNQKLPKIPLPLHRKLIKTWIGFIEMENNFDDFMNLLYIKAFIWVCEEGNIKTVQKRYYSLPTKIYLSSHEIFFFELSKFLDKTCRDFNDFHIYNYIFNLIQRNFVKLQLSGQKFNIILKKYISTLKSLLHHIITNGYSASFREILVDALENLIYFPTSFFEKLYSSFTIVYEMNIKEGNRFKSRIEMIQTISITLEKFLVRYDSILSKKHVCIQYIPRLLPKEFVMKFLKKLKSGSIDIFHRMHMWLIEICSTEYIQSIDKFEPIMIIFQNVLEQFKYDQSQIIQDFEDLIKEIFSNQKMLIDNKKKFFKMMLKITKKSDFPDLHKDLRNRFHFIQELSEIESLYYTISQHDNQKIELVRKRLKKIKGKYEFLFTPWFIYANTFALQEKHQEAIDAFLEALKYESNFSNFARLYHNLIVSYIGMNDLENVIKIIKKMEIGIKTDPLLVNLIRKVEELSNQRLLGQI